MKITSAVDEFDFLLITVHSLPLPHDLLVGLGLGLFSSFVLLERKPLFRVGGARANALGLLPASKLALLAAVSDENEAKGTK